MENRSLKEILRDVEAKLSLSAPLADEDTVALSYKEPVGRLSYPEFSSSKSKSRLLLEEIVEVENAIYDLDKLNTTFYNFKEAQLTSLRQDYDLTILQRTALYSTPENIAKYTIIPADKSLQKETDLRLEEAGVSLFPVFTKTQLPATITIRKDSNVKLGLSQNPTLASDIKTLLTSNLNDLFVVHRIHDGDLLLSFVYEYANNIKFNSIEVNALSNQEEVLLEIRSKEQELLYAGVAKERIALLYPIETSKLIFTFKLKGEGEKELQLRKLLVKNEEYKEAGYCCTIGMPSLSGKYLTVEKISGENLDYFNIEVYANEKMLYRLEEQEQIQGPFIDPEIQIFIKPKLYEELDFIKDLLKYEEVSVANAKGMSRVFTKIADAEPVTLTENGSSDCVLYKLNVPGHEGSFIVEREGTPCERSPSNQPILKYQYQVRYAGNYYVFKFSNLSPQEEITIRCASTIGSIDNGWLQFKHASVGKEYSLKYAKSINKKSLDLPGDEEIFLGKTNIQSVVFYQENSNSRATKTRKAFGETLNSNEYYLNDITGIIKVKEACRVEFKYLVSSDYTGVYHNDKGLYIDTSYMSVEDVNILDLRESAVLGALYSYTEDGKYENKFNASSGIGILGIQRNIALVKDSVRLKKQNLTCKEVPFVDGQVELYLNKGKKGFYDFVRNEPNYSIFAIREELLESSFDTSKLEILDTRADVRVNSLAAIASPGDYFVSEEGLLYIKLSTPLSSISSVSFVYERLWNYTVFSVDYKTNTLYCKFDNLEVEESTISFKYLPFELTKASLSLELFFEDTSQSIQLGERDYIASPVNVESLKTLYKSMSPIISTVQLGYIG